MKNTNWLVGRQEIGQYARVSTWTVTAMIHAGLKCSGGRVKGSEPRTKCDWVDDFFEKHPNFIASHYHRKGIKKLKLV